MSHEVLRSVPRGIERVIFCGPSAFWTVSATNLMGPWSNFAQSEGRKFQQKQRRRVRKGCAFCPSKT